LSCLKLSWLYTCLDEISVAMCLTIFGVDEYAAAVWSPYTKDIELIENRYHHWNNWVTLTGWKSSKCQRWSIAD
jgi:hypothetical protein